MSQAFVFHPTDAPRIASSAAAKSFFINEGREGDYDGPRFVFDPTKKLSTGCGGSYLTRP